VTTYVDTSSLVKLAIREPGSDWASTIWAISDGRVSVALIAVEGRAALARAHRAGRFGDDALECSKQLFGQLVDDLELIEVDRSLIARASDLAEVHALRACDAVHLATAELVQPGLVTSADIAFCEAASAMGFDVANPTDDP
jgi:predicted nucleic acid-binding protein